MNRILWMSAFYLAIMAFFSGCATIAPQSTPQQQTWQDREAQLEAIQSWQLNGKIAILTSQGSGSATVNWAQTHQQFVISLFGPLGMGEVKLSGQPGKVILETASGKHFTANAPEELLVKQWGWKLPVSYLNYWIRGLPVPRVPHHTEYDAYQRLHRLIQSNWEVQFLNYTTLARKDHRLIDLPSRISITSPTFKTKIIIYQWTLP